MNMITSFTFPIHLNDLMSHLLIVKRCELYGFRGHSQVLRNAFFLEIGPPPTPS